MFVILRGQSVASGDYKEQINPEKRGHALCRGEQMMLHTHSEADLLLLIGQAVVIVEVKLL